MGDENFGVDDLARMATCRVVNPCGFKDGESARFEQFFDRRAQPILKPPDAGFGRPALERVGGGNKAALWRREIELRLAHVPDGKIGGLPVLALFDCVGEKLRIVERGVRGLKLHSKEGGLAGAILPYDDIASLARRLARLLLGGAIEF
jgi:hypothetical protein